jgi:hypothetical protein
MEAMLLDSHILIGALAVLVLILVADVFFLRQKVKKLLRGGKNENLGDALKSLDADIKKMEGFKADMEKYLRNVEKRLRRSSQVIETIRFNAFKGDGIGGNQSFATAMIDENGNGAVLSSLYSRDRVSVFAKPISNFASEIELSEEEKQVVAKAKSKLSIR